MACPKEPVLVDSHHSSTGSDGLSSQIGISCFSDRIEREEVTEMKDEVVRRTDLKFKMPLTMPMVIYPFKASICQLQIRYQQHSEPILTKFGPIPRHLHLQDTADDADDEKPTSYSRSRDGSWLLQASLGSPSSSTASSDSRDSPESDACLLSSPHPCFRNHPASARTSKATLHDSSMSNTANISSIRPLHHQEKS